MESELSRDDERYLLDLASPVLAARKHRIYKLVCSVSFPWSRKDSQAFHI